MRRSPATQTIILSISLLLAACGRERKSLDFDDEPARPTPTRFSWTGFPITVQIDSSFSPEQQEAVLRAMRSWELALRREVFSPEVVDLSSLIASLGSLDTSLSDGANQVYPLRHWAVTGKGSTVLATTVWSTLSGRISTSDIAFNLDNYDQTDAKSRTADSETDAGPAIVDMESVAVHELGHFLGLPHVTEEADPDSVMNPSILVGAGYAWRGPSDGDLLRAQELYGCSDAAERDVDTARADLQGHIYLPYGTFQWAPWPERG